MAVSLGVHDPTRGNAATGNRTISPAAGSCIVAAWIGNAERTPTISDNKSGSYTHHQIALGSQDMCIAYALNVTGGSTIVSFDNLSTATDFSFFVMEFISVKTSAAGDGTNDITNTTDTTPVAGSLTTTGAGVVIGVNHSGGNSQTYAPDCADASPTTGWLTVDEYENPPSGLGGSVIYQVFATSGTRNPGWTISVGNTTHGQSLALLETAALSTNFIFPRWSSVRR